MCSSFGVTEHVGWVKNGWILSFFHAKKNTNSGKTRDYCGCQQFLSHKFATDVKMGTDDHVPFYPALLNSL